MENFNYNYKNIFKSKNFFRRYMQFLQNKSTNEIVHNRILTQFFNDSIYLVLLNKYISFYENTLHNAKISKVPHYEYEKILKDTILRKKTLVLCYVYYHMLGDIKKMNDFILRNNICRTLYIDNSNIESEIVEVEKKIEKIHSLIENENKNLFINKTKK